MDERAQVAQAYRELGPAVYRRCLFLLRDREAARDATQEVFRKLLRDPRRLDDRRAALPFLYKVATNHCLNERRNRARRGEDELHDELPLAASAPPELDRQLAQQVLSRFDVETQAVAVGVLVDEMEHEELAEALGISRRTVSRKLERFLQNARKFLSRSTE